MEIILIIIPDGSSSSVLRLLKNINLAQRLIRRRARAAKFSLPSALVLTTAGAGVIDNENLVTDFESRIGLWAVLCALQ